MLAVHALRPQNFCSQSNWKQAHRIENMSKYTQCTVALTYGFAIFLEISAQVKIGCNWFEIRIIIGYKALF